MTFKEVYLAHSSRDLSAWLGSDEGLMVVGDTMTGMLM
jgi:hypothetical protein